MLNGTLGSAASSIALEGSVSPFDPTQRVTLGRSGVSVTQLGLGTAEIGGLYRPVSDDEAVGLVGHAWDAGVRYFDTAPLYGYGNAELRLGLALRGRQRDGFIVSTKVGRLLVARDDVPAGAVVDRQQRDGVDDAFYTGTPAVRPIFDFSRDAVTRSLEASLERLGLDRVDIAYIHDPDDHWEAAIRGAYPALHALREAGVVGAIGAGMNQAAMLARFAREGDFDAFMLGGRYTLLDQSGLAELLPLCLEKGISVVAAGIMNSGLLADPKPGALFDYVAAPPELVDRARRIRDVCGRHGVGIKAAAIQFPLAHPAVAALVAGVRSIDHFDDYPRLLREPIPDALWAELRSEDLIAPDAPVPGAGAGVG
jgi:D-threo-aldose 1-dehydrogenase